MGKKQEIIESAYRIFQRHGYRRTNVEDIAKVVGMRKSGLYYYFESKEDLFIQTFMGEWVEKLTAFCERLYQEPDIRKRIMRFAKGNWREVGNIVTKFGGSVETILENRSSFGKEIHCQVNDISTEFYCKTIEEGITQGIFREINPLKAAKVLLGTTNSIEIASLSMLTHEIPTDQEFKKIENHILLTLGILLDGLTYPEGETNF